MTSLCPRIRVGALVFSLAFVPLAAYAAAPEPGTVKILVPAGRADSVEKLARTGARFIAGRGYYDVYSIQESRLPALSTLPDIQARPDFDSILLHRVTIDTRAAAPSPAGAQGAAHRGTGLMLVQFAAPPLDEDLDLLQSAPCDIVHYIPENAYLIWAGESAAVKLHGIMKAGGAVQFVGDYLPLYALSPRLDQSLAAESPVDITVQIFNYGPGAIETALALADAAAAVIVPPREALRGRYINVTLAVAGTSLAGIAERPEVVWIEPYVAPTLSCERQGQIVAGNLNAGQTQPTGPGYLAWLAGKGFPTTPSSYPIIDVVDDGFDNGSASSPANSEFRQLNDPANPSRVQYAIIAPGATGITSPNAVAGHGNINCSIMGGYNDGTGTPANVDSSGYHYGLGVSPYGRIASNKLFTDSGSWGNPNEDTMVSNQYGAGVRVTSNSWGAPVGGSYTTDCQDYDRRTRDAQSGTPGNQEMFFVFSAGNDGEDGSNTVGSPGGAKNVLCVGASENYDNASGTDGCGITNSGADNAQDIISFSSRGPCDDSRVKPDIVAPGTHIHGAASYDPAYNGSGVCDQYSPAGQTKYAESSGTSHSTPGLAGCASLVYNYLDRVYAHAAPSPALLKAYLLHAARHMTGVFANDNLPSNSQGYGIINLGFAFDQSAGRYFIDQTEILSSSGQTWQVSGAIPVTTQPFRVALVWTDPPGPTSGNAYVNNLDLQVTVNGTLYRGNNFTLGNSVSGGSADVRNNTECVFLPAGASGSVVITVVGTSIAGDGVPGNADLTDQDFALVVYNFSADPTPTPTITPTGPTATPTETPTETPTLTPTITPTLPPGSLWYQPVGVNTDALANQKFPDDPTYDIYIADDFQNAVPWMIGGIFVPGDLWNGGTTLMNATSLNWQIYADDSGKPDGDPAGGGNPPVWSLSLAPGDAQVTISNGVGGLPSNATLYLTTSIALAPGIYWLVFYPEMEFGTCGQYGRHVANTSNVAVGQVINPGGGFSFPTVWTSIQDPTTWGLTEHDLAFQLMEGTLPTPTPTPTNTPTQMSPTSTPSPTAPAPVTPIDLTANKTTFRTTDQIGVTANVAVITTPCYPFVRIIQPNGQTIYFVDGGGIYPSVTPFLGVRAGPITVQTPITNIPILAMPFKGIPTGTYILEGGAVDATKTTSVTDLKYVGTVDRETLIVQ